jgi:CDP-diacylglycerol---glycerol-3-phosphate 3-phosphatidyltransferase
MKLTLADKFTFSRIVLLPLAVVLFYASFPTSYIYCAVVFLLISITDILDGYIARRLDQVTEFGAFLDPVMDKVTVVTGVILLVSQDSSLLVEVLTILIVVREVLVSALREFMAQKGLRNKVAVYFLSKCKTVLQCLAIIILILAKSVFIPYWFEPLGEVLLLGATGLTVWTLFVYLRSLSEVFSP